MLSRNLLDPRFPLTGFLMFLLFGCAQLPKADPNAQLQAQEPPTPGLDADLSAAFVYTFPYYEMARSRYLAVDFVGNPGRSAVNTLSHRRAPLDHTARNVTTPNNDTLYSTN
jgi:hypothetical protein